MEASIFFELGAIFYYRDQEKYINSLKTEITQLRAPLKKGQEERNKHKHHVKETDEIFEKLKQELQLEKDKNEKLQLEINHLKEIPRRTGKDILSDLKQPETSIEEKSRLLTEFREILMHQTFGGVRSFTIDQIVSSFKAIKDQQFVNFFEILCQNNPGYGKSEYFKLGTAFFMDWYDLYTTDDCEEILREIVENKDPMMISKLANVLIEKVKEMTKLDISSVPDPILRNLAEDLVTLIAQMATAQPRLKFLKPKEKELFNPTIHESITSDDMIVVVSTKEVGLMSVYGNVLVKAQVVTEKRPGIL